ncbi:MAG: hypothetical protein M3680_07655 [Myxococcota bacterium]|nr:hypothetical protein [Myxococcota bacterium]
MAKLTSAAWIAHDVGLATAIGGTLFGKQALHPALSEVESERDRARLADVAWRRFSWINLAAHGVVAVTWFVGRKMLTGREVSPLSRQLTVAKDAMIAVSLVTGVASVILGRVLGQRTRDTTRTSAQDDRVNQSLRKAVGTVGTVNLLVNAGIGGITTALSMEASQSLPFAYVSRRLP